MEIYSYSPKSGNSKTKLLVFSLLALAVAVVIVGGLLPAYKGVLQAAGFVVAIVSVMLCARFIMTSYTYIVEDGDSDGCCDFVIKEARGGRTRTVCRIEISGSALYMESDGRAVPKGEVYDYRPSLFVSPVYRLCANERDGGGSVRFCADDELIELLLMLGTKKKWDK
jgi:hypothetical protein